MRIQFPLEGFNRSGGLRIIIAIANCFAERGWAVKIIVPNYASEVPFPIDGRVTVDVVKMPAPAALKRLLYRIYLCANSARGCDVAFATGYKTAYYHALSAGLIRARPRLIYLIQGYEPVSHALYSGRSAVTRRLLYWIAKWTYRLPLEKIAVSCWLKANLRSDAVTVIPNGINLKVFSPAAKQARDVLTIGVIGSQNLGKGYLIFNEACSRLAPDIATKVRVLVATNAKVVCPKGLEVEVQEVPNDAEMVRFYRRCDIFVQCSFVEGFGLPPLEAMACGVPVILAICGGASEYANDSNAVLIEAGNVGALAGAITELVNNDARRDILRRRGLETAKRFCIERTLERYVAYVEAGARLSEGQWQ